MFRGAYGCFTNYGPRTSVHHFHLEKKILLQDRKRLKHWFSYHQKTVLNSYTKEIFAKRVST